MDGFLEVERSVVGAYGDAEGTGLKFGRGGGRQGG